MFILLVAVFTVALVGLLILLISKYAERRTGKNYFSPKWLLDRDPAIKRGIKGMCESLKVCCIHFGRFSFGLVGSCKHNAPVFLKKIRGRRFAKKVETNGGGSVYLKEVIEHKNNVRNGDGGVE